MSRGGANVPRTPSWGFALIVTKFWFTGHLWWAALRIPRCWTCRRTGARWFPSHWI